MIIRPFPLKYIVLKQMGIPNVLTTSRKPLYEEFIDGVKLDLGPTVKDKYNIVSLNNNNYAIIIMHSFIYSATFPLMVKYNKYYK